MKRGKVFKQIRCVLTEDGFGESSSLCPQPRLFCQICSLLYRNDKIAENWNKLAKFLLVRVQKSYITRKGIFQLFFCKLWH